MSAFAMVWFAAGLHAKFHPYLGVAISVMLAIATAVLVYRWFEFPLTRLLQRRARSSAEKRSPGNIKAVSQQA
jgi:peptidoglycan/LPS O-acetylase OafA/YrhL